jgi:UDP-2-acetamido-3-amino-2,3-dideoxy-glucuronate N-acetyltransferase
MLCPESGYRYHEAAEGKLRCLDLKENTSLPGALAKGTKGYDEFKHAS